MAVNEVKKALRAAAVPGKATYLATFFKSTAGYPATDKFIGLTVPQQRVVAKQFYKELSLADSVKLLQSPWHEERLTALFILILKYKKEPSLRQAIYEACLKNSKYVDNWDLVDSSAEYIVGAWLDGKPEKMKVLAKLAVSKNPWERRIAMLATFYDIKRGSFGDAFKIIDRLVDDKEPYLHKAVGWMLREIGKRGAAPDGTGRGGREQLIKFLDQHAATMPRTALRYAIEHLPPNQRRLYLAKKLQK